MTITVSFKDQFLTFFAALGDVSAEKFFELSEAEQDAHTNVLRTVHAAAYAQVKATYKSLPGYMHHYVEHDVAYDIEQFEIAADDVSVEVRKATPQSLAQLSCGIGFFTEQRLSPDVIDSMATLVYKAYAEAAASAGHIAVPMGAESQVTEMVRTTTLRPYPTSVNNA